ncbi:hypothetical protein V7087_28900 [Neobacillus niacini]|uniref:hypothetical protein n=1 Tax=Neobacillus niacini TaxID=86668 RepID=UPI002FFDA2F1
MEFMKYEGEWYVWTLLIITILFVIFMPKKTLTWAGIFITILFSGGLTWIGDTIVGSIFDLFTLAKKQTIELTDSLLISFVPAGISAIYINFYNPKDGWIWAIVFTLLCFFLELGLVKVGYMINHDWKTWYGILVYFIVFKFFYPWYLKLLSRKLVNI